MAALLPLTTRQTIASNLTSAAIPDAPQPLAATINVATPQQDQDDTQQIPPLPPRTPAPRLAKYIEPGRRALPLSNRDKLELSAWEQIQPYSLSTLVLAAGWEQLLDSNPQYGTDSAGFGERLGAATILHGSQSIFSDGIAAAVFRQDPRYYMKGSGRIVDRIAYAASRVVLTRTDNGNEAVNYSKLVGYAAASALTMTYYPAVSANWPETTEGYFLSLAGAALGNGVHEFLPQISRIALHRHR